MTRFPRTADASGNFPPLETGWYKLRVQKVEDKTDKNGAPYWSVEFWVVDHGSRLVWQNFKKDETWLWLLRVFLECINPELVEKEFDSDEIIDEEVMAFITPDGKYNRIKQFANKDEPQPTVPKEESDDETMPF
jgi:hypothetical protein